MLYGISNSWPAKFPPYQNDVTQEISGTLAVKFEVLGSYIVVILVKKSLNNQMQSGRSKEVCLNKNPSNPSNLQKFGGFSVEVHYLHIQTFKENEQINVYVSSY